MGLENNLVINQCEIGIGLSLSPRFLKITHTWALLSDCEYVNQQRRTGILTIGPRWWLRECSMNWPSSSAAALSNRWIVWLVGKIRSLFCQRVIDLGTGSIRNRSNRWWCWMVLERSNEEDDWWARFDCDRTSWARFHPLPSHNLITNFPGYTHQPRRALLCRVSVFQLVNRRQSLEMGNFNSLSNLYLFMMPTRTGIYHLLWESKNGNRNSC